MFREDLPPDTLSVLERVYLQRPTISPFSGYMGNKGYLSLILLRLSLSEIKIFSASKYNLVINLHKMSSFLRLLDMFDNVLVSRFSFLFYFFK